MAEIGPTHLLALNKFSAARPHLLLLTQDGFRRQHEALDIQDFTALWQVLSSLGGGRKRYLAIFNCGIDGGCSRLHKHMQLFPAPDADKFALWPDSSDGPSVQQQVAAGLPFKCFIHRFENGLPLADALLGIYQTLLAQAEDVLDRIHEKKSEETGADEAIPHNVVLDRNWILVVPRRAAGVNGADANAAAMLGMVWVANDQKLRPWMEHGPANVLARVGVPADIN
ncbi:ATP adenylyltransferase-domain-containing protein [Lasiosphaeria miniovina]|uniref:ATP adenylyltransferase-domain-containing protein n=1 Tax=Lasiosphaeria miniovina TaxID=1954250 RepID=A0AA40B723_9PEZI|nr:ATP adenylyltransferase-domain-containing protein [Lasiosphaeria miniovina]KAK0728881.1 ATP adenylyltransferase-domain-containing protein [Lasiosphaeria miniovina]